MNKLIPPNVINRNNYLVLRNLAISYSKCNKVQEQTTENWRLDVRNTMKIFPNFISPEEEKALLDEIEPYIRRLRYENAHWDHAIHGYREIERSRWNETNAKIINRIREKAFPSGESQIGPVHVLDIADDGWIKPHVDSVKFCGNIIAGLSLLSDSIMRLTMVGHEKERIEDFFLPRGSLYIMSGTARYDCNHEILKPEESYFNGKLIERRRRISVICRSEPMENND